MIDFTTLTDDELTQVIVDAKTEQENRVIRETYPPQIESMSARYYKACGLSEPPVEAARNGIENAKANAAK